MTSHDPAVSRETAGRRLFGAGYDTALEFDRLLRGEGVLRGLVGPRESERMWERHVLNCAAMAPALPREVVVVDVGSGAGLPGIALAIARPDLRILLLEPLLRRVTFLEEAVRLLALPGVEVRRGRAEDQHGSLHADVVTARAVAPLDRLAGWCLPLVRAGGSLLAMKGAGADRELDAARDQLERLGARDATVETYGAGIVDPPVRVVRVVAGTPRIPARSGGPAPRPTQPARHGGRHGGQSAR